MTAKDYIQHFQMQPHPEGGYYAETYRSAGQLPGSGRAFSTAIYFLLETHHRSALHRIDADEGWHFYAGDPLTVYVLNPESAAMQQIRLGPNLDNGETFQAIVPAGHWFGAVPDNIADGAGFSLVGCTVAPGFDFAGFELANRVTLLAQFPEHRPVIEQLT